MIPDGAIDPWDHNYPAFDAAETTLKAAGYDVLNPASIPTPGGRIMPWDWYMRRTLTMLLEADAVAVLPGYEHSRGARLECTVANGLRMRIETVADWISGADAQGGESA